MHVSQPDISLYLTHHTVAEIDNTLTATNTTYNGAHEHLYHPNMHIKLNSLRMLNTSIHPTNTHGLSHRIIYHHLLISSRSPLTPLDRSLSLIMYNAIYPLTPLSNGYRNTTFTYSSTHIRGHPVSNTHMKAGAITNVQYPRNALPYTLVYQVLYFSTK